MPPPSPSRRDESSPAAGHDGPPPPCDCGGCREAAAIYAEPRREESRGQREGARSSAANSGKWRAGGWRQAFHRFPPTFPQVVQKLLPEKTRKAVRNARDRWENRRSPAGGCTPNGAA